MKKFVFMLLTISLCVAFFACEGPVGPAGPAGPAGPVNVYTVTYDSDGGSPVNSEVVVNGGKANEPKSDPVKGAPPGLYLGDMGGNCTFEGWYNSIDLWDFDSPVTGNITLKAKWTNPDNLIDEVPLNNVEAAIDYVRDDPNFYTLLLGADVSAAPQTLDLEDMNLAIYGTGGERRITLSGTGALFTVGASGESDIQLTLGNNITLVGSPSNNNSVVRVQYGAKLVMLEGSKITGNTNTTAIGAAVYVNDAEFNMQGGEITGNTATNKALNQVAGGVRIESCGDDAFLMEGGSISGNTGVCGDVYISDDSPNSLKLAKNATIGVLTLNASSTSDFARINFVPVYSGVLLMGVDYTGRVGSLNLRGNNPTMSTVIGYWESRQVLARVGRFSTYIGYFTLGNFMTNDESNAVQPIGDTHRLSTVMMGIPPTGGMLILK